METQPITQYDILYIEDDATIAAHIIAAANAKGLSVKHASIMDEARELIRVGGFKYCLTDMSFPHAKDMQPERLGFDVVRRLQFKHPEVPFLIHTSYEWEDLEGRGREKAKLSFRRDQVIGKRELSPAALIDRLLETKHTN